jgi:hypothetical protein
MGSKTSRLDNTIRLETLKKNMQSFTPLYLQDVDTLILQLEEPVPAISVDCNGDLYLRINPETMEIVGIEIEDFEDYFIVKYPAFAPIWKDVKGMIKKHRLEHENLTAFLTIIQELLSELVANKQGSLKLNLATT